MSGHKSNIAQKLKEKIENVTVANGYSYDINTVEYDKIKLNIAEYKDYELPAVQLIDLSSNVNHEMTRSKTSWFLSVEICMRTTTNIGIVDQESLWDITEDVIRAIMVDPRLGLTYVVNVTIVDSITDLHLLEPNYIANIGLEVVYYEPITRDNC